MFSRLSSIRSICVPRYRLSFLPGAFRHQVVFLLGQLVVFFCLQVFFPGNQFVLIQGFLLLVRALEPVNLHAIFQHILADVQFLLFHLDLRVAEDVLLLGQFGLGIQDGKVQVVIVEDQDGIAGLHRGTLLDEDLLHDAAFLRAQLDGGHRLDAAADADIVVELSLHSGGNRNRVSVYPQCLVVRPGNQVHDKCSQQCAQPPGQGLLGKRDAPSGFLFNKLIHIFYRIFSHVRDKHAPCQMIM